MDRECLIPHGCDGIPFGEWLSLQREWLAENLWIDGQCGEWLIPSLPDFIPPREYLADTFLDRPMNGECFIPSLSEIIPWLPWRKNCRECDQEKREGLAEGLWIDGQRGEWLIPFLSVFIPAREYLVEIFSDLPINGECAIPYGE